MLPANKSLDRDDRATGDVDLRLVEEPKLAVLDGVAQPALGLEALDGPGRHLLVEQFVPPPAALFGTIHGSVGIADQLLGIACPTPRQGDADAPADNDFAPADLEGLLEGGRDALGDGDHVHLTSHAQN